MKVSLTWQEQLFAAQAGVMRRISAISRKRSEPYLTPKGDLWGIDIESAGAEAAVAKALGKYWLAVLQNPQDANGDVSGVEVRSTTRPDGRLIVHDRDKDDSVFVLVRGSFPIYDVVGWIYGRDGKKDEYLFCATGRLPAYYVPEADLLQIDDIPQ
jgi:hypothetical protein